MTDISVKNQKTVQNQAQQVKTVPVYATSPVVAPIVNNNGYLPTYGAGYYTNNFGYQLPCCQAYYPTMQQPASATISSGGQTYEVKPGTGGVNIILNSPTVAAPGSQPMINTNTNCNGGCNGTCNCGGNSNSAAPVDKSKKSKKVKNIVAITEYYVKNLENYLRSPNKELKTYAVKELGKRFEEDESRKTNPSLNALLNLALQAKEQGVRFWALSLLTSGLAGGNDKTVELLTNMQQSKTYMGQEANDAKKALLKMSETVVKVPDNSPDKPRYKEDD